MAKTSRRSQMPPSTSSSKANWIALGVLALGVTLGVFLMFGDSSSDALPDERDKRPEAFVSKERDLYTAMDAKDPSGVGGAFEELTSPDEGVRLAALRYLTSNGEHADPRLLRLLDDDVDRVRRAAIQLLGSSCKSVAPVRERLEAIVANPDRDLAEKTLAKQALEVGK